MLILLGLRWLPKRLEEATPSAGAMAAWLRRSRDLVIAVAAGAGLSTIAYAMMMRPPPDGISRFFLERAQLKVAAQRRQRHPRRLPRLRHARRNHRARHRGAHCLCTAASVPTGAREYRRSRSSSASRMHMMPAIQTANRRYHRRLPAGTVRHHASDVSGHRDVGGVSVPARTRPARAGASWPALPWRLAIILQYMAGGTSWVEVRLRIYPVRWMAAGLLSRGRNGCRRLAGRISIPHVAHVRT